MNKILSIVAFIPLICFGAFSDLRSANDYIFSYPIVTNRIIGKVMGDSISYRYPRSEDIAFINEWLSEADNSWYFLLAGYWYEPAIRARGIDSLVFKQAKIMFHEEFETNAFRDMYSSFSQINGTYVDDNVSIKEGIIELGNYVTPRTSAALIFDGGEYYIVTNKIELLRNMMPKISAITNMFCNLSKSQSLKYLKNAVFNSDYPGMIENNGAGKNSGVHVNGQGAISVYTKDNQIIYHDPITTTSESRLNGNMMFKLDSYSRCYNFGCCNILGEWDDGKWKITNNWYQATKNLYDSNVSKYDYLTNGMWTVQLGGYTNMYYSGKRLVKSIVDSVGVFKVSYSKNDMKTIKYNHNQTRYEYDNTNYMKYVAFKIPCEIWERPNENKISARWNIQSMMQFFKTNYPDGVYDLVIATQPNYPAYDDVFDTLGEGEYYKNATNNGNENRRTVSFTIQLVGYYMPLELQYHTTYH